jgi:hypothetical protein
MYEGVSKSFRTGSLERELQMVQLSATKCSCIAILWVILVSFATITLRVTSQRVFIVVSVYFIMSQSGNFWIHSRISSVSSEESLVTCIVRFEGRTIIWYLSQCWNCLTWYEHWAVDVTRHKPLFRVGTRNWVWKNREQSKGRNRKRTTRKRRIDVVTRDIFQFLLLTSGSTNSLQTII